MNLTTLAIVYLIIIALMICSNIIGSKNQKENKIQAVFGMLVTFLVPVLILIFFPLTRVVSDFLKFGEGINLEDYLVIFGSGVGIAQLVNTIRKTEPIRVDEHGLIMGYEATRLPKTWPKFFLFVSLIITTAISEEFFFRKVGFESVFILTKLKGDLLVVAAALVFAIPHFYQGWQGLLSNFILGLVLGKIYLDERGLVIPIMIHILVNLSLCVVAFHELKKRKSLARIK